MKQKIMPSLLSITEIVATDDKRIEDQISPHHRDNFRAYTIESTAQATVEEVPIPNEKASDRIRTIVRYILDKKRSNQNLQVNVVVQIHGYNTGKGYADDYAKANREISKIQQRDRSQDDIVIFLGYTWPSEKISLFRPRFIYDSLKALPLWLQALSLIGTIWFGINNILPISAQPSFWLSDQILQQLSTIQSTNLTTLVDRIPNLFMAVPGILIYALLWIAVLSPIVTIVLLCLRASVYFRDSYRATNYGVPDLVQFFRAFEYLLLTEQNSENKFQGENSIKLSFIGHSMGGFVVTNLIRVLSDVFDTIHPGDLYKLDRNLLSNIDPKLKLPKHDALSIVDGETNLSNYKKNWIGKCFSLERLVLVSPDIPVNAILSNRSNFLSSSLSRFKESYLFSNEGDMVLLLLSTVANYISFPSTTSQMGYKLGNLGIRKGKADAEQCIAPEVSAVGTKNQIDCGNNVLDSLVIGTKHQDLTKIGSSSFVAQEFTYFDCTSYLQHKLSLLNFSKKIRSYRPLNFLDYLLLAPRFPGTHGGYFEYDETLDAIYTIACKGLQHFQDFSIGDETLYAVHGIKVLKAANLSTTQVIVPDQINGSIESEQSLALIK